MNWFKLQKQVRQTRKRKFCPGCATKKLVSEFKLLPDDNEKRYSIHCKACTEWYLSHEIPYMKTQTSDDEFVYNAY